MEHITTSNQTMRIYATLSRTEALGPYMRFALWVQGCKRDCAGCMSQDARSFDGGALVSVKALAEQIAKDAETEGITISGGEPFEQPFAVSLLIDSVRMVKDAGVIAYTGYTMAQLIELATTDRNVKRLLGKIDILIDGPYMEELNDGLSLRGSSNQVVHQLTDRYRDVKCFNKPERSVELHLLGKEIFLAGIPGRECLNQWKKRYFLK